MPAPTTPADAPPARHHNEVRLVGRLAAAPAVRSLPSGDTLVSARLVVRRDGGRPGVDTLDCVAFRAGPARRLLGWQPGDDVEILGALRRRFWRAGTGVASRCEVEVRQARRVSSGRRATPASRSRSPASG